MTTPKPVFWVGSSKKDLRTMPEAVVDVFGYALHLAQNGGKHPEAKPLKGFGSAGVIEVVEQHFGDTYRAVLYGETWTASVRIALFSEEIQAGR